MQILRILNDDIFWQIKDKVFQINISIIFFVNRKVLAMNPTLRIKNYKKISEEIYLKDFSQVNYIVGKNSCGKSSILNALSHLKDGSNSRRFFTKDSVVEFSIGEKKRFIAWEDKNKNPNHTSDQRPSTRNCYTS